MNTFNRKASSLAGLLILGFFSSLSAHAAESTPATMCHQETRRVAVWPTNPKLAQVPRFENRTLTVCDHDRATAKPERAASASSLDKKAEDYAKLAASYRARATSGSKQETTFRTLANHSEQQAEGYRRAAVQARAMAEADGAMGDRL